MEEYNQPTDLFLEEPVVYAGFWERFGAAFIDGIILLVARLLLTLVIPSNPDEVFGTPYFINLAVSWLYFAFQESGPGQATVGKRALGIKVTDVHGERISFAQATGRLFSKYIPVPLMVIGPLVGQTMLFLYVAALLMVVFHLMMLWDDKSQALHDKLASTLVIKSKA